MPNQHIVAIDQSTSMTKALMVNSSGHVVWRASREHKQYYPKPGWVEHDVDEIYENVKTCVKELLKATGVDESEIAALSLTNQRETALMWDRVTGRPVNRAVVWQCQRTAETCKRLKDEGYESMVRQRTGLLLDPYFSATKWAWMLQTDESARALHRERRLLAGTMDSWILWKLTLGKVHATDVSNASRTSLFNIHTLSWDEDLCELFGVPMDLLPTIRFSDEIFGSVEDTELFSRPIPIAGVLGDSQAALFGGGLFEPGQAKATYGTGTSVLMNAGRDATLPTDGLVTTIAWGFGGEVTYAIEAIIRSTGDTIRWVRDELGMFRTFAELDECLKKSPDSQGVFLVPAFHGLGAPYWDSGARAGIFGISRTTTKSDIVRAAVESIAFQVAEAIDLMGRTGIRLVSLHADGGASDNTILMQFQSDVLGVLVSKASISELSAMGVALMAGHRLAIGPAFEDLSIPSRPNLVYHPQMSEEVRQTKRRGWDDAVKRVLSAPPAN